MSPIPAHFSSQSFVWRFFSVDEDAGVQSTSARTMIPSTRAQARRRYCHCKLPGLRSPHNAAPGRSQVMRGSLEKERATALAAAWMRDESLKKNKHVSRECHQLYSSFWDVFCFWV